MTNSPDPVFAERELARTLLATESFLGRRGAEALPDIPSRLSHHREASDSSQLSTTTTACARRAIKAMIAVLRKKRRWNEDMMKQLAKQHGALLKTTSLHDISNLMGKPPDTEHVELYGQQISRPHAGQDLEARMNHRDFVRLKDSLIEGLEKLDLLVEGQSHSPGSI